MFEYCVIGNGLIGASVAAELADKSESVCVLGAIYGQEDRYYSSHEDDSRIARWCHSDKYWEDLARHNATKLGVLAETSGLPILRCTPVFYNYPHGFQPSSSCVTKKSWDKNPHARRFEYQDHYGGIIDPKIYIAALNHEARKHKAKLVQCVVHDTHWRDGKATITSSAGEFCAKRVVDARGVFLQRERTRADALVVGKIMLYAASSSKNAGEPFCFLDSQWQNEVFEDIYGIVDYKIAGNSVISKFGFSEREPVTLNSDEEIAAWFQTTYLHHPHLEGAMKAVKQYYEKAATQIDVKPCAFVVTADKRPIICMEEDHVTITGCNGMAAKCCQALAEEVVRNWNVKE